MKAWQAQWATEGTSGREDLGRPLQWLIVLRVAAASVILVTLSLLQADRSSQLFENSLPFLQALGAGVFLATIGYAFAIWRQWNLRRLGLIQLAGDLIFITALQWVTGGIDSGFSFLYILAIIVGAFLFHGRGAFGTAFMSTLAYGGLVAAQGTGWISVPKLFVNPVRHMSFWEIATNVCFNAAVFFVVALLCGYFAEQLRATHAQLREREGTLDRLRVLTHQIVASMGSGLLTVDFEGRVSFINETGEKLLRVHAERIVGRDLSDLLPAILESPESATGSHRREIRYVRPGGDALFLGCSFSELKGEPGGRILIFQDLTDVKAAEERARRSERLAAVGELSAGMAHEIRNPMAAISGCIEMLAKELHLTGQHERLMKIVLREVDRLNRLVSEFLQFARPQEIKRRPIALADLLRDTTEVFLQEKESGALLEIQLDVPADLFADGDVGQVRQVVWNLLLNARDAMPQGGVIRIFARRCDSPEAGVSQESSEKVRKADRVAGSSGWVELCFEDEGIGIPEKDAHRIFEPFFTTKEHGTGLGLATVYRIVEAHGGSIHAEGGDGMGARFRMTLPLSALSDAGE